MAVITISRQSGSEGNEITRILCERLGYGFFDKKMLADLAVNDAKAFAQLAERVKSA